ncbi:ATP-dependent RNA helicase DDX19/DBP5 [Nematocida displodere]|uniref:RNA helicase n=1 Tax=Nematocida displodere TaxID=1805483 RepID=A0A177EGX4_9MICR|nr:ATP-dependent RNA helicase DDX19/DBP5 [Nematocida displodere]
MSEASKHDALAEKKEEPKEEVSDMVKAALDMLSQMEISKKENDDVETYKKSLLDSNLLTENTFEEIGVPEKIIESLYLLGFKNPSVIQKASIPDIATGDNVAFQSHSGSGKTIAFLIGALMKVDKTQHHPQVIIISPTRDLSKQIFGVLEDFKGKLEFTSLLALGDQIDRHATIKEQIIVGPPGTVKFAVQNLIETSKIKMIILDEADALLTEDIGAQTIAAVRKVPQKQLVLFSATFNDNMKTIVSTIAKDIKTSYLEKHDLKPANISQFYIEVNEREKIKTLIDLYGMITTGQSIVFVQTRDKAAKVQKELEDDGFDTSLLHGQLTPEERDSVIAKYKKGEIKVLVTTNVLSRGLDVPQLNLAVNYDVPRTMTNEPDVETYVHRIGRTGRFNRSGVSVTFIAGPRDLEALLAIQSKVGHCVKLVSVDALKEAISENLKKHDQAPETKKE